MHDSVKSARQKQFSKVRHKPAFRFSAGHQRMKMRCIQSLLRVWLIIPFLLLLLLPQLLVRHHELPSAKVSPELITQSRSVGQPPVGRLSDVPSPKRVFEPSPPLIGSKSSDEAAAADSASGKKLDSAHMIHKEGEGERRGGHAQEVEVEETEGEEVHGEGLGETGGAVADQDQPVDSGQEDQPGDPEEGASGSALQVTEETGSSAAGEGDGQTANAMTGPELLTHGALALGHQTSNRTGLRRERRPWKALPFYQFSAYRVSSTRVYATGLVFLRAREPVFSNCSFVPLTRSLPKVNCHTQLVRINEAHRYRYEAVVIFFVLEQPSQKSGGVLSVHINGKKLVVLREARGMLLEPPHELPLRLSVCTAPLFGQIEGARVIEWIRYHAHFLHAEKFFLYDAGAVDQDLLGMLATTFSTSLIDVVNFKFMASFNVWSYAQNVAVMDCIYRNRLSSTWVLLHDMDEYVHLVKPPTISALLTSHATKPWITLGCYVLDYHKCRQAKGWRRGEWAIEHIVFRDIHPYCVKANLNPSLCPGVAGHRKFFVQPRFVDISQIHIIRKPHFGGQLLDVSEARLYHYRGMTKKGAELCTERLPPDFNSSFVFDETMRNLARRVRRSGISW